jgi:tRNA uridine 5-carbamoylmethylation protein Kti12
MKFKVLKLNGLNDMDEPIKYEIELRGYVTIVSGNSGTGKTLLCDIVKQHISDGNTKFIVIDATSRGLFDLTFLKNKKGKIIFIDDADLMVSRKILNYILKDRNNYYVMFRRDNYDVHLSPNYYATIVWDTRNIGHFKYDCEVVGWY